MSDLKIFENAEFGSVRSLMVNGEPYFVGKDVAEILGYANTRDALAKHVDEEDKTVIQKSEIATLEIPNRGLTVINESGVYALTFSSKLPSAKRFKHWVTYDVLPSIRKYGLYAKDELIDKIISDPDFGIRLFTELKEEREKNKLLSSEVEKKTEVIESMKPKVSYYDIVLQCKDTLTTTMISKDYGMSAKKFNKLLNDLGIQFNQSGRWFLYADYDGYGYAISKTNSFPKKDGTTGIKTSMYWTQKGRLFLYEVLKKNNIVPTIEQNSYSGG